MECQVNKPYPKIMVEGANNFYAKLLMEDYSGVASELTSITQYVYQKFDKFDVSNVFADTLSKIAMVEMKHLELLGETIKLLGVHPKFLSSSNRCGSLSYWNSGFDNYTTDIISMLFSDIEIEKIAIQNYLYHISIIDDKYIKNLLYRIIEDEEKHIECFNYLLCLIGAKNS